MGEIYTPYVLQCMRFQHESRSDCGERTVMDYEFDFCVGCDREMWLDGQCYPLKKGNFVVRKPGQKVRSKGKYDCYMLTLDFSKRANSFGYSRNTATQMQPVFSSEVWDVLPSVFCPTHTEDYARIFESMLAIHETNINENKQTRFLINELLHLLLADAFASLTYTERKPRTSMDRVCEYIKQHYMEEIRLDQIASIVHLNKHYLIRQFKKEFGVSPIAYLINVRMERAKKLLTETDLPIGVVAATCGYTDSAFFTSYFKKMCGESPASYRRSARGRALL